MGELRHITTVFTTGPLAQLFILMLEIFIGTIWLNLIEHTRAWVFKFNFWHLDSSLLNIGKLDRCEELVLFDLVDTHALPTICYNEAPN